MLKNNFDETRFFDSGHVANIIDELWGAHFRHVTVIQSLQSIRSLQTLAKLFLRCLVSLVVYFIFFFKMIKTLAQLVRYIRHSKFLNLSTHECVTFILEGELYYFVLSTKYLVCDHLIQTRHKTLFST